MQILTDRSRITCGYRCPRERYWRYHHAGRGIEPVGVALAPETGIAVHEGIEAFIKGTALDDAVAFGAASYPVAQYLTANDACDSARAQEEITEQLDLVEGLIRAWAAVAWPVMQRGYETLAVEREELAHFDAVSGDQLVLMVRPDWLVRRCSDGSIFIVNFKTVSDAGKSWREQWRYDMCTLSECLGVEERLSREAGSPVKLGGVIIQGLLKGRHQEYPQGSGRYEHNSPLIRCWYRQGEPPMTENEYYPLTRYEYDCVDPHLMGNGRRCPGGKHHRLSGVVKRLVRDVYPGGVEAWIQWLAGNDPDVLRSQIVELPPILRSDYDIERWKAQTIPREVAYASAAEDNIEVNFPMASGDQCTNSFGRPCTMLDLCWGTASDDPIASGLYKWRTPNHKAEREALSIPTKQEQS